SVDDIPKLMPDIFLLDTYTAVEYGGTGRRFDWSLARTLSDRLGPVFLAGGISPENVRQAIEVVDPFAIDVCSSIESSPGRKDPEKMKRLFKNAKRTD
ncbi:MAG: phosphoribosylanthranilate isomerase, partial [Acidobacteriota bacterium]